MGNKQSKLETKSLNYIDNLISYLIFLNNKYNIDIDNYYYDLLEQAIEYGMTPKQFWEEEIEVFYCYRNAYMRKLHNQCHTQGLYNSIAFGVILGNMFKEKGKKSLEYPNESLLDTNIKEYERIIKQEQMINNNIDKKITKNITRENLEEQYRLRLAKCY